ncbi:hypothetical protein H9P43_008755 [Blastocladiella emersonii ATCC 22665]|nr:hypothetical protein H9P43_008755 [Blastocladiella emersonii ATCC 22665]
MLDIGLNAEHIPVQLGPAGGLATQLTGRIVRDERAEAAASEVYKSVCPRKCAPSGGSAYVEEAGSAAAAEDASNMSTSQDIHKKLLELKQQEAFLIKQAQELKKQELEQQKLEHTKKQGGAGLKALGVALGTAVTVAGIGYGVAGTVDSVTSAGEDGHVTVKEGVDIAANVARTTGVLGPFGPAATEITGKMVDDERAAAAAAAAAEDNMGQRA